MCPHFLIVYSAGASTVPFILTMPLTVCPQSPQRMLLSIHRASTERIYYTPGKQLINESYTAFSPCFTFLDFQATPNFNVRMRKIPCDYDTGELSDTSASPGGPVPAGGRLELGQCLGTDSPSASRRGQRDPHLDFGHQDCRTVREHISAVLRHKACSNLLRQPQEMATEYSVPV